MQKQAIFLMGPTAAGKTALAMQLYTHLPVDIISVDSAMVYRGMDIGTGKPNAQELAGAPHQLINICDPSDAYSAARFVVDARAAMESSWQNMRIPLLVGGTMLYFKALQFGLAPLPAADQELRDQFLDVADMHARLMQLDPQSASRLHANDTQRVQRALEINILTGKTVQENLQQQKTQELDYHLHTFALVPHTRAELHDKIAQRFDAMLAAGFIAEVEELFNRADLHTNLPSIRSVGYRQAWSYLDNKIEFSTMREQAIAATRQLAKRQHTWLRSWQGATYCENSTRVLDTIVKTVLDSINN